MIRRKRMKEITDEFMKEMMMKTKEYTVVILKATDKIKEPGTEKIIWEHGRRNFRLREEEILSIVCPIRDGSDINGVGIFSRNPDEVKEIMDGDPGVIAGIFDYEIHLCRSFPGDKLP
jgi:hypothetical protein